MPLYGAGMFLELVEVNRILWLRGRQGGGKTSLAFMLAEHFLSTGQAKYICANIPNVWNTRARDLRLSENGTLDTVFIADEGGRILRSRIDAESYIFGMRKTNTFIFIPSFLRPSSRVCFLDVQFLYSFTGIGLPFKYYKWRLSDGGQMDTGWFIWWGYQEIYGVYSSKAVPLSDGGSKKAISKALTELAARDKEFWDDGEGEYEFDAVGRVHKRDGDFDTVSALEEVQSEFEDTAERTANEIAGTLSVYQRAGNRKRRY